MTDASRPSDLRVEHLRAPLGVGADAPRVSWKLPDGSTAQHAYRVVANDWDSGRVESVESTWRPVGVAPRSGLAVEWKVKTWTDLGESEWSEPSTWEHGLLDAAAWTARWIAPIEHDVPPVQRPAWQLAGTIRIDEPIAHARLHATAHGVYECFMNATRVDDCELTPGWTAYRQRIQVQTYDVTDLLHAGDNVVGAVVSDGWWRGQNSVARRVDDYGKTTAFLAQLVVTLASGATLTFGTDEHWRAIPSHIVGADLIAGEVHDLRRRVDWSGHGGWEPVRTEPYGYEELCASPAPPVRRVEELRPRSIREIAPGRIVVDFGQNISGWTRLRNLGPTGTTTTLTYGEWLDKDGDVTQENIAFAESISTHANVPYQQDTVIAAGRDDDVFESRHSTKGFQYVRVEGYDGPVTADDIAAVVVHTDFERLGAFACSDERVNAIHRIAQWSFRGNACDIPTDCPTRERAGWTGDWQIYVETAAFLYDVGGFSVKWLRDLAAEQRPDGKVTNLVPESHPGDDRPPEFWPVTEGSSGWGDAAVHVPWIVYRTTGDRQVLAEQWPSMVAWVDYAAGRAANARHRSRVERSAEPEPHERFLWDTGWHYGEWHEGGEDLEGAIARAMTADPGPVATAYLYRSARELGEIAHVLDRNDAAERYEELAADVADAWRQEFLHDDGTTTPDSQATYARALTFGLVPDDRRAAAADRLVALIRDAGNHLATGFLSTPFLLPILADTGHLDVAYDLLGQDTEPSWLVMVDRGASTVWEEWGGVDADGVTHASLNHYSKGAVITFLHQYIAGLQAIEPGYRHFRVAPHPAGGITWATATHDSPYGRIDARWEQSGNRLTVVVAVPPGTTADVVLPNGNARTLTSGRHTVSS